MGRPIARIPKCCRPWAKHGLGFWAAILPPPRASWLVSHMAIVSTKPHILAGRPIALHAANIQVGDTMLWNRRAVETAELLLSPAIAPMSCPRAAQNRSCELTTARAAQYQSLASDRESLGQLLRFLWIADRIHQEVLRTSDRSIKTRKAFRYKHPHPPGFRRDLPPL